jgi:spermidine synthase
MILLPFDILTPKFRPIPLGHEIRVTLGFLQSRGVSMKAAATFGPRECYQSITFKKAARLLPWEHIDIASIPGGGELRLKRRGAEFSIMLGDNELMNSRLSGSEEALATLSAAKIGPIAAPKMLIGGLGMGFTLRAALKALPPSARVDVAELVPAVLLWARGPMAEVFKGSLDDCRVNIREGDVGQMIRSGAVAYDAILLDVDNGPDGLTRKANDGLYDPPGLAAARKTLKPGGVLAVWSSGPDEDFSRRLRKAGFAVEEVRVRAGRSKGARHVIWLGVRPAQG